MRGSLKIFLLFLISISTLIVACEDDLLSPASAGDELRLLQKHIWENEIKIDEQFIDHNRTVKYIKHSTLSFTPSQYTHTITNRASNKTVRGAAEKTEEYWGDYEYAPKDSIITLHYTVSTSPAETNHQATERKVVHARYKIKNIHDKELILMSVSDSSNTGNHPEITFKAKN